MKNFAKNALVLITAVVIVAIYSYYTWLKEACDEYVAMSQLKCSAPVVALVEPKADALMITKPNYAAMTIRELKALCKGSNIKGWSRLTKPQLIAALSAM